MPEYSVLILFIPTIFLVSISPGMCMTLAMTLGLQLGIKKTLWMMLGELLGVATVAITTVLAVASISVAYPLVLQIFKWCGAIYLIYLGIRAFLASAKLDTIKTHRLLFTRTKLLSQGYITAIANPKGWAFMIALLPPLFVSNKPFLVQMLVFVSIILISEFICMMLYATSGHALRRFFHKDDNYKWINRITGALLISVGIWLVAS